MKSKNFAFKLPYAAKGYSRRLVTKFFKTLEEEYPELKIIGLVDDKYADTYHGVQYAKPGAIVEFNNDETYDVNWWGTTSSALAHGVDTGLNLFDDWDEIMNKVDDYVEENYPARYHSRHRSIYGKPRDIYHDDDEDYDYWTPKKARVTKLPSYHTPGGTKISVADAFIIATKNGQSEIISRYAPYKKPKWLSREDFADIKDELVYIGFKD